MQEMHGFNSVALAVAAVQASPIDPTQIVKNAQGLLVQLVGGVMAIGVIVFVVHAFFHPERSIMRIIGIAALAVVAFLFIVFPSFPLDIATSIGQTLGFGTPSNISTGGG